MSELKQKSEEIKTTPLERLNSLLRNSLTQVLGISTDLKDSFQLLKSFDDIYSLPDDVFKHYFFNKQKMQFAKRNETRWNSLVASAEDIIKDYDQLEKNPLISTSLAHNFYLRAIEGHAQEGHVFFSGKGRFPNTQLSDVFSNEVLQHIKYKDGTPVFKNKSADSFRTVALKQSQRSIDNTVNMMLNLLNGENFSKIKPSNMFGIKLPFDVPINSSAFFKGFFFGSKFDSYEEIRRRIEERFGIVVGGGSSYMGNIDLIKKLGFNLDEFANGKYRDPLLQLLFDQSAETGKEYLLDVLERIDLIQKPTKIDYNVSSWNEILEQTKKTDETPYRQIFLRKKIGLGVSDDLACMIAAYINYDPTNVERTYPWYHSLQISARLADLIDTVTKESFYVVPGGFDFVAGKFLNNNYVKRLKKDTFFRKNEGFNSKKQLNLRLRNDSDYMILPREDIINLTALSLNPNSKNRPAVSTRIYHSSGKNFLHQWTFLNKSSKSKVGGVDKVTKDITSTMEQEMRFIYRKLEEDSIPSLYIGAPDKFPGRLYGSNVLIGFHRVPFSFLITYFNEHIFPIVKSGDLSTKLKTYFTPSTNNNNNNSEAKFHGGGKINGRKNYKNNVGGFNKRLNRSRSRRY